MKAKGNFSKALNELLCGKLWSGLMPVAVETTLGSLGTAYEKTGAVKAVQVAAVSEGNKKPAPVKSSPPGEAVITQDMVIKGSVVSNSNILMEGTIIGDVTCEGDIAVKGKIEGNVHVRSLSLQGGTIQGDIESSGLVFIGEDSKVNGNIKGGHIDVHSSVIGNITSTDHVTINPKAIIEGDIAASGLSMFEGAELKGTVNIQKPK